MDIGETLASIKIGDKIIINDRRAKFTVCGLSEHYVLAHYGKAYTILKKTPFEGCINGVREGDYVCAPDWWIFGYEHGYDFTNRKWVQRYMEDLETGDTQMSVKNHAVLFFLSIVGHTNNVYAKKESP